MKINSNDIKDFETQEISRKLLKQIKHHQHLDKQVIEYNNKYSHFPFENCLTFLLGKIMVEYQPSIEQIHWKNGVREKEIIEGIANKEALSIIIDYLNTESKISMGRFMVTNDPELKGKDIKYVHSLDFSLICSPAQLKSYTSIIFSKENHECIISYYLDYIYRFPIELSEFEKIFFYFLTILTKGKYPIIITCADSLYFVLEINKNVKMSCINMNGTLIQALIHLISVDDDLLKCSNLIYAEIKHNDDLLGDQVDTIAS